MQVFYRPEQSVHVESFSPSAGKPALVVADWSLRFGARLDLVSFDPAAREDFYRVHERDYVDAVFDLQRSNGFGTREPRVVEALRYTNASMRAAALAAWRDGGIAVSPTSGFHHASHAHGGGFCTFNGLVLAALAVLDAGARRIAIIDCDYHYGNGTENILALLGLHDRVQHWTLGADPGRDEQGVLASLDQALSRAVAGSELILYQAGADSHRDDPLGGVFSTPGYRRREQMVFSAAARAGVPVAWNLAGGYQSPVSRVLALHAITLEAALAVEELCAARRLLKPDNGASE